MLPKEPIWERWKIHTFLNIFNYYGIAGQHSGCPCAPLLEQGQAAVLQHRLVTNYRFHIELKKAKQPQKPQAV